MTNLLELLESVRKRSGQDLPIQSLGELEQAIHLATKERAKAIDLELMVRNLISRHEADTLDIARAVKEFRAALDRS